MEQEGKNAECRMQNAAGTAGRRGSEGLIDL
jgi:hypothetical protein